MATTTTAPSTTREEQWHEWAICPARRDRAQPSQDPYRRRGRRGARGRHAAGRDVVRGRSCPPVGVRWRSPRRLLPDGRMPGLLGVDGGRRAAARLHDRGQRRAAHRNDATGGAMGEPRVIIGGAGPAGVRCAEALLAAGVRPTPVDESRRDGGQIYRRQPETFSRPYAKLYGTEAARAEDLHRSFERLRPRIDYRPETLAWNVSDRKLHVVHDGHASALPYDALIVCSGATDRLMPVKGWQFAGTYSLGAAQIALKAQACAIGRQVVFLGSGPLLYLVASQYVQAGAQVAAVLDTSRAGQRLRALPKLLARPDVLKKGAAPVASLKEAGVTATTLDELKRRQQKMDRFRLGLVEAFPWPAAQAARLSDDTVVCRCEGITVGELRRVIRDEGACEANRAKAFSRVAMGRCQGRYCGHAAAEIIADAAGVPVEQVGRLRGQAPVKPLAIATVEDVE